MNKSWLNIAGLGIAYCLFASVELFGGVSTCDAPRNSGVQYRGTVRNSSYRFSAVIPPQRIGWGADPDAPFHGFTIYLAEDARSCIGFSIGVHVSLPEDEKRKPRSTKPNSRTRLKEREIKGNGWTGVEATTRGLNRGTSMDNIAVTFSLSRSIPVEGEQPVTDTIDVGIILVTPAQDRDKTEAAFRQFLSQLSFW